MPWLVVGAALYLVGSYFYGLAKRAAGLFSKSQSGPPSDPNPARSNPIPKEQILAGAAATIQGFRNSDDRRKAEIRARVERKIPPIDDSGRESIARGLAARIAIKHVFPPRLPQRSMSYLGGLPIVPDDFDWPSVLNRKGLLERLTFMAQVDCAQLPAGPARDLLPESGYLYFFAPMSDTFDESAYHFVARYLPGRARKTWEPLDMPFTGGIEFSSQMEQVWPGKRTHYTRVEIEFGWIDEPGDAEIDSRSEDGFPYEVADALRKEREDAFYGQALARDSSLLSHHAPKKELWRPYPEFPLNWKTARIVRTFVEAYYREETEDVTRRLAELGEVPADHAEAVRLRALQDDLRRFHSRMFDAFFPTQNAALRETDAPPDDYKRAFMAFLESLYAEGMPSSKARTYKHLAVPDVIKRWFEIAAINGAEAGLVDPTGAAFVPPEVTAALEWRHQSRRHQMLGQGEVVQTAADDRKDRYVLLLQLGPDDALDWTFGDMGMLQYWITPEDLAARRFENTVATFECH